MRGIGLMVAAGLVLLLPAAPAAACSCAPPQPVSDADLDDLDAAFTGEVTGNEDDGQGSRRLDVAVDRVWTGTVSSSTVLLTPSASAACGADPEVGTAALFYVYPNENPFSERSAEAGALAVYACGGVREASGATALGPGRPPDRAPAAPATDGDGSDDAPGRMTPLLIGFGLVVAAGLGASVVRRRRARPEGQV